MRIPIRFFSSLISYLLISTFFQPSDAKDLQNTLSNWQELKSVEDFWQAYPDRMRTLIEALDLSHPGMQAVEAALQAGDTVAAGEAMVNYYRNADSGSWLRNGSADKTASEVSKEAIQLIHDTVSFSGLTAAVRLTKDGGWDWDYRGPEKDDEFGYSLNGQKYLPLLLEAWQKSGEPKYAEKYDQLLKDWVVHHPLPPKGDSIYLVLNSGDALDWRDIGEVQWRDLEAGQRLGASWPQTFYGFQQAEAFTPAARLLMLASIPEQTYYLRNYHKQGHNWTTMEMNGLALAGLAFPEFKDAEAWAAYALEVMQKEINRQVYPDGVQTELSTKTQWVALSRFESVAQNFNHAGREVPESYLRRIEEMYNYMAYAMRPDGHQPLNNDSDREDLRPRVLTAAETYDRPDWQWIATNGAEGVQPEGLATTVFPWAGINVMRNSWDGDAHWAFFDVGPFGTGHQHSDKLHISIAAYGRDLLVDGGRYTHKDYFSFDPSMWRGYFRSTFSHNTILVDGKAQNGGPTMVDKPLEEGTDYVTTPEFDYARGTFSSGYNGVEGSVAHSRAVFYVKGKYWVVVDHIDTDGPHKLEALWHYAPHCTVSIEGKEVVSTDEGEGNLRIVPIGATEWNVEMVQGKEEPYKQGWYSADYGKKVPNPTMVYTANIDEPSTFAWVLMPTKGKVPKVEAEMISITDKVVQVKITEEGTNPLTVNIPLADGTPGIE